MDYVWPQYQYKKPALPVPPALTVPQVRLDPPGAMLQLQRQLGNRAVTGLLAPPSTGTAVLKSEDEAESAELPAANATLAKSRTVAKSLEGSGGRPPMEYWFAKLYEFITEAEIAGRGAMAYPGFLLSFIPMFYDLYASNVERYRPVSSAGGASRVADPWKGYFNETEFGDDVVAGRVDLATQALRDPRYLVGGYLNAVTLSVLAGVSAHVNGDMAHALAYAYDNYRARYVGSGPFNKYRGDFFEKNRPVFDGVRVRLVGHLLDKMDLPGVLAPQLLDVGDSVGVGGPRVDDIYAWRERAWSGAQAELAQRESEAMDLAASAKGARRSDDRWMMSF